MTYTKPYNVSYTDMCIWIDNNAYDPKCDEIQLYEYLYHLVNMLAHENKYFNNVEYYDNFALYSASKLCLRLKNNKQFEYNENGERKLAPIKSILNYIKTVIYPYKVDFEQEYYNHSLDDFMALCENDFDFSEYLTEECKIFSQLDFSLSLGDITTIIKSFLKTIPIKQNSAEWTNIYLSCLLTILNSITASPEQLAEIEEEDTIVKLDKLYLYLRTRDPILYHLDPYYSNYIKTLVAEIRQLLTKELTIELHSYLPTEAAVKNLLLSSLDEELD